MKLLVLDGNSIINRAFYGIKLLTTKDGRFTNGIYGFLNVMLKLCDEFKPDGVAAAFDLKGPTFRHGIYGDYKAGRKPMPDELAGQIPVLKELLSALGHTVVECEGYEADDILGTLSRLCSENDEWECVIATGDRDSLQLVGGETEVMLAATKMGRPVTTHYTPEKIFEEYGVEPKLLIDIKALMGDSSDNIPGVAGIGKKTASDLVSRFGGIDEIYGGLDELDIKQGVRDKLSAGRESAFLSRTLGTINCAAPIETDLGKYASSPPDVFAVTSLLTDLEMFGMLKRLNLKAAEPAKETPRTKAQTPVKTSERTDTDALLGELRMAGKAYFTSGYDGGFLTEMRFFNGEAVSLATCGTLSFPSFVRDFSEDDKIKKFTFDCKPLYAYAHRNGTDVRAVAMDMTLAGYVLNPSSGSYQPDRLAQEYGASISAADEPESEAVLSLPELCDKAAEMIAENGQNDLLYKIEIPLARVLASMENAGFEVDEDGIVAFGNRLDATINGLTAEIFDEIGFEFNLNSPKQLGEALFDKMGIPARKKTKNGYSTSADVLEGLEREFPVVEKILQYRTLAKLKSTYCDGLLKVISSDGRIHSTLNQTETRTGRISSADPNLQNIPVRSELGREMRKFFKARDGHVLVDADYSQIELRVLAHISGDETMIKAFNDGDDVHAITASQVFNMPLDMVTPLMRSRAKAVNFGIVYGIGAFSLAKDIGVTRAEADRYIKEYLRHYSGVDRYMQNVVARAKETGYAETMFARRRYLPELGSSNGNMRAFGERVARNMPIQGTAADIIKIAMIRVHERLAAEGMGSRLIMQVHDELIVEAPEGEAEKAAEILKHEMENAAELRVRLEADVHIGKTWYDAK